MGSWIAALKHGAFRHHLQTARTLSHRRPAKTPKGCRGTKGKTMDIACFRVSYVAGLLALIGEIVVPLFLGKRYPNYSHLKDTVSELGVKTSPVSRLLNLWLVTFGFLTVIYALGLGRYLGYGLLSVKILVGCIVLFGIGAGVISGIFPLDPGGKDMTASAKIHHIFGGAGYMALLAVPFISLWLVERWIFKLTGFGFFLSGSAFFVLFVLSEGERSPEICMGRSGLWQRFFLASNYLFLIILTLSCFRTL